MCSNGNYAMLHTTVIYTMHTINHRVCTAQLPTYHLDAFCFLIIEGYAVTVDPQQGIRHDFKSH